VLRGKEEGGDEPCIPAVLELCFEARHDVPEIGRQFGEGDGKREKKTYDECLCRQWVEEHICGDHGITKDCGGQRLARRGANGYGDDDCEGEPEQVFFPCSA